MYKRWMQMAGREQYNNEIEANALDYGYKTANLMYLEEAVREFEASEGAAKLHELYGDIRGEVPAFKGVDARIIETHLDTHAHEWRALFENFQNHFSSQVDKSVLDEPAKESLKNLQEVIKGCFEKHQISQDLFNEFLTKNDLGINDLVMVRSTGVHEDKADMANPGGNESLPSRANILEITRALGVVAASYVGEKSLSQRLGAGDTTIAEFPVMPGLVQRMIDGNVYSGVLYSNDGSTRIQAAPGHGEYVVNSKGRVDNYYVSSEDIVYSEIRPKDFRLKPRVDLADGKVKLERAENPFELRYESALPEPVVLYLNELGKFIEKKYGKRMDMEFVYKPEAKAINIVQARSITKNKEIVLTPSAVSPDFLGMNKSKLNIVEGLQVITPDISRAAVIIDPKQVIVCNSIAEALSRYNDKSKDTGIRAVIVQNPAPDTSHEAGMFNSAGIRVMQVKDITAFENLLKSKQPIVIDPQHSKIYEIPLNVIPAEAGIQEGESPSLEQRLYDAGILANGIYASPLTSYVTAIKHELTAEGVRTTPVATEGVLQDKKLGQLLAEAKTGDTKATEQLLLAAYGMMNFKSASLQEDKASPSSLRGSETISSSLRGAVGDAAIQENSTGSPQSLRGFAMTNDEKLRTNLETLTAPKIGQSNDKLKVALGYNMRLIADFYKKGIISEDLFKQSIISGTEVGILLDKMTNQKEELTKEQKDKIFLEYFHSEKKFYGLMLGEGNSIATSLKHKQYEVLAETLNPAITSDAKTYLVESLKLRDYLISDEQRQNWDKFCAKACANPENAKVLGSIVNKAVSFNAHEQWVNYIFADVNDTQNPQATLARLVKDFNEVDLNKIKNAADLIKSMESQIPEWSDPAKCPKLYKELQENIKIINENLKWNKEATNLEKVLILEQVNRLTDVMDKSCKSLERSSQYPDSLKDAKGNDLQTARFKDMVTEFYGVMRIQVENKNPQYLQSLLKEKLIKIEEFLQEKNEILLDRTEFSRSDDFSVNRATIDQKIPGYPPSTLEDCFSLIHQNALITIAEKAKDFIPIIKTQYPVLVRTLDEQLDNNLRVINPEMREISKINPSSTIELDNKIIKIKKNIPLRMHSAAAEIKYNNITKTTSLALSMAGPNEHNRWDHIMVDNYLALSAAGCEFITPPHFNSQQNIHFEIKIDNKDQILDIINEVNKSLDKTFIFVELRNEKEDYYAHLINERLNLYKNNKSLQKKWDPINVIPGIPLSFKELDNLLQDNYECAQFVINNTDKIKYLLNTGLSWEQFREIYEKNPNATEIYVSKAPALINDVIDIKDFVKKETKPTIEYPIELQKLFEIGLTPENFEKLYNQNPQVFSDFIQTSEMRINKLEKLGVSPEEVNDIMKQNPELMVYSYTNIIELIDSGLPWSEFKELYEKTPSDASFFINNAFKIGTIVFEESFNQDKDRLQTIQNLSPIKQILEIYKENPDLTKTIIKNAYELAPILRTQKFTLEDLKKCSLADIQNLAKGTITAEQLKKDIPARTKLSNPPTGKWTAQVQEGRQTLPKENKGSQR